MLFPQSRTIITEIKQPKVVCPLVGVDMTKVIP